MGLVLTGPRSRKDALWSSSGGALKKGKFLYAKPIPATESGRFRLPVCLRMPQNASIRAKRIAGMPIRSRRSLGGWGGQKPSGIVRRKPAWIQGQKRKNRHGSKL